MKRLLLLLLLALLAGVAVAAPGKKMLVLYKSSEKVNPKDYEFKWHIEPALTKQGWKVDYHNADSSLPADTQMAGYQAVASWHRSAVYSRPLEYVRWMRDQLIAGRKVLIFGNFGAFTADEKTWLSNDQLNEFFVPFGLEYGAAYSGDAGQLQVVGQSPGAKAPQPLSYYLLFRSINPANKPLLVVKRKDLDKSESALVVVTPRGAMVGDTYLYQQSGGKIHWLVDRAQLLAQGLTSTQAADRNAGGGHLLALYKGTENVNDETNYVARFLAPTLKELGYTFDSYDITKGLPDRATMARYSGVISWYQTASMENAAAYCNWLLEQIVAGRKVVVLGNLGAFQELDTHSNPPTERWLLSHEYNTFLYPFGLEFKSMWTKDSNLLRVGQRDNQVVPFLDQSHLVHYYWIQSRNPANKVSLSLDRKDVPDHESAIVVRTPYGGYVLEGYLFRDDSGKGEYRWHVDMKKFLSDVLTYKPASLPVVSALKVTPSTPRKVPPSAALPATPALPADAVENKRRILAFYQKDQKESSERNRVQENCALFLNHIGLVIDFRAIEDGLPSEADMQAYRGIITWFGGSSVPDAPAYADWLKHQIESGRKVVIMGDYGAYQDKSLARQVNPGPVLKALGVDWRSASPISGIRVSRGNIQSSSEPSIEFLDPEMCKSEYPIKLGDPDLKKGWPTYISSNPANKVYLKVKDGDGQTCDAVVVTPHGGLVAGEFFMYNPPAKPLRYESIDPNRKGPAVAELAEYSRMRIDGFRFFTEAFQTQDLPICDATTLNGSRIYFSHIDGDAMQGMSFTDRASINAEVLYKEIIAAYNLPVTVSFVTNNLEFKATGTYKRELEIARKILTLPWVEVASHSTTHPFDWRLGDLRQAKDSSRLVRNPVETSYEVVNSIDFTNQLIAPSGKRCKVMLWTGKCNPNDDQLAACDGLGLSNMNGGNPLYDEDQPYVQGVAPLYQVVEGGRYQFHTCSAGDFHYTGAWTRDYDGMKNIPNFFRYTEEPRRLRAMNLYYHFYLAERQLGIDGLKVAMKYVMEQKPAYMYASNYIDVVKDMIVARTAVDKQGNIVVANAGAMRTVRFDNQPRRPELARCTGVLGYNTAGNRLYVHLDDSKVHRIALADKPVNAKIYLERASHYIDGWKPSAQGVTFSLRGSGPALLKLAGLEKNTAYKVSVTGVGDSSLRSDASGVLTWEGVLSRYEGTYAVRVSR